MIETIVLEIKRAVSALDGFDHRWTLVECIGFCFRANRSKTLPGYRYRDGCLGGNGTSGLFCVMMVPKKGRL